MFRHSRLAQPKSMSLMMPLCMSMTFPPLISLYGRNLVSFTRSNTFACVLSKTHSYFCMLEGYDGKLLLIMYKLFLLLIYVTLL